ncbi:MAG: DUF3098 domain-containing protein [Fidelibacterota bacterium]
MKTNSQKDIHIFEGWSFSKTNYILFGAGLATVILGYILMAIGDVNSTLSLSVAPVMLFVGYIVIIPLSLIYRDKKNTSDQ